MEDSSFSNSIPYLRFSTGSSICQAERDDVRICKSGRSSLPEQIHRIDAKLNSYIGRCFACAIKETAKNSFAELEYLSVSRRNFTIQEGTCCKQLDEWLDRGEWCWSVEVLVVAHATMVLISLKIFEE
jgi:hypothetical protein